MQRTLDEVRVEGLNVLVDRLGRADMIRFLQQFETGGSDCASDRKACAERSALGEIEREAAGGAKDNGG